MPKQVISSIVHVQIDHYEYFALSEKDQYFGIMFTMTLIDVSNMKRFCKGAHNGEILEINVLQLSSTGIFRKWAMMPIVEFGSDVPAADPDIDEWYHNCSFLRYFLTR